MKTFRLFATALTVALCCTVVSSCSDDDGQNDISQDEKRISRIVRNGENANFRYSNGKLNGILYDEDGDSSFITYSGNNVTISGNFNQTIQLNSDGYAESGAIIEGNEQYRFTCEYSNGYLAKVNYPDSYENSRIEISYNSNGNISTAYEYSDYGTDEFRFTYSEYLSKAKSVFVLGEVFSSDSTLDLFGTAYYAGLLGKDFPNLVSSIECKGIDSNYTIKFEYSFDDLGYVTAVTETITYESESETNRISLTYE